MLADETKDADVDDADGSNQKDDESKNADGLNNHIYDDVEKNADGNYNGDINDNTE